MKEKKDKKITCSAAIMKRIMEALKKANYMKPRDRIRFMLSKFPGCDNKTYFMFVPEYTAYSTLSDNVADIKIEMERRKVCGYSK